MRRIPFIIGGALGLCVAAAPCAGTEITFDYRPGGGVGVGTNYSYNTSEGAIGGWTRAGQIEYKVTNVEGTDSLYEYMEGNTYYFFCTDLFDTAQDGTAKVVDLSEAPVPENMAIGDDRANLIRSLYTEHYYDAIGNDALAAAGFQAAIWEFAFEGGFKPGEFDSTELDNGFSDSDFDALTKTGIGIEHTYGFSIDTELIANKAYSYAQDAWDRWNGGEGDWWKCQAAGTDDFQDLVIIPIPLPAPIALAGVGLLGVLAGRRKLARLVK